MLLGCGSSAKPLTSISLSVSVPADGATVAAPQIEVEGTVIPAAAFVRVAGHPVSVRGGEFSRAMLLHRGTNRIHIVAAATGLPSTGSDVTVRYQAIHSESAAARRRSYLIGQVNSACAIADGFGVPSRRRLSTLSGLDSLLASDGEVLIRLQGIRAPSGLRSTYRAFLGSVRQLANLGSDLFDAPPIAVRRVLAEADSIGARGAGLARQLGFTQCVPNLRPGVLPLG